MGEAKLRGSFEERREQALYARRTKRRRYAADNFNMYADGHRNSGIYNSRVGGYTPPKKKKH